MITLSSSFSSSFSFSATSRRPHGAAARHRGGNTGCGPRPRPGSVLRTFLSGVLCVRVSRRRARRSGPGRRRRGLPRRARAPFRGSGGPVPVGAAVARGHGCENAGGRGKGPCLQKRSVRARRGTVLRWRPLSRPLAAAGPGLGARLARSGRRRRAAASADFAAVPAAQELEQCANRRYVAPGDVLGGRGLRQRGGQGVPAEVAAERVQTRRHRVPDRGHRSLLRIHGGTAQSAPWLRRVGAAARCQRPRAVSARHRPPDGLCVAARTMRWATASRMTVPSHSSSKLGPRGSGRARDATRGSAGVPTRPQGPRSGARTSPPAGSWQVRGNSASRIAPAHTAAGQRPAVSATPGLALPRRPRAVAPAPRAEIGIERHSWARSGSARTRSATSRAPMLAPV